MRLPCFALEKSPFRDTEYAFRTSEWPFRVTEWRFRITERRFIYKRQNKFIIVDLQTGELGKLSA